ncbi:MAG: tRNA (adenosine(37)-N6)-dimethylallyltransferase MiaA [Candidatus Marinimicrobia bacterium]|nr:tRNA (adenosine(37)-N6)-dimethylallyltransferase MiaA [Candidatus Neomarinimicrobiota bacterium]
MGELPKVLAIVGPTAVGKTAVGIRAAKELNGEIISADARQLFRGMNVGTAKPSKEELQTVPHHLIDILDPGEYFSAGIYAEMGHEVILDIISRGKLPIIVGGSGLYFRALVDGLFTGDSRSDEVRKSISGEIKKSGVNAAYERLLKIDEEYAKLISRNDEMRISRALEVYEITGKTLSESFAEQNDEPRLNTLIFGLRMERKLLVSRIEERVEKMIATGLVEEVKQLLDAGHREDLLKIPTIGYNEVIAFIDGEIDETKMLNDMKVNSRRYAKRQMTWFKKDERINWIDMDFVKDAAEVVITAWRDKNSI